MRAPLLLVEDEDDIRTMVRLLLESEGFGVVEAADAEQALAQLEASSPALVLLDIRLPGAMGFDLCRTMRQRSDVPIIVVTALQDSYDVVAGLEAGADDYVTKPFVPKELTARVRALLRRFHPPAGAVRRDEVVLRFGDVELLPDAGVVRKGGEEVALTKTEFLLLKELAEQPGRFLSRQLLLERVWGYEYLGDSRLVDAHIRRLRTKVEHDPGNPSLVVTVRGLGYKLVG